MTNPAMLPDRSRWRDALLRAALAAVLFAAVFELGVWYSGFRSSRDTFAQDSPAARVDSRSLTGKITQLETNDKVNREAYRQIESQLAELQDKIIEQQEELAFYRGVVAGTGNSAVSIQELTLSRGAAPAAYHLRLVLAQAQRADREIAGTVGLRVEGNRNGRNVTLDVGDIGVVRVSPAALRFSFRYFQKLDAELSLPADFTPARIVVKLIPTAPGAAPREESFPWVLRST